jgi:hypothetical protein
MIIEVALFLSFVAIVGAIVVKVYEWRQGFPFTGLISGTTTGTSRVEIVAALSTART